jgi:hypothetical protein
LPTTPVSVRRVDADGIALWGFGDRALDVLFDGRRVWSFWLERDTRASVTGRLSGLRSIEWPSALRKFLDGNTRLGITEHVSGRVLFDRETSFGTSADRIQVVGRSGAPISLDKSGRISPTFDTRTAEDTLPLLRAIDTVLDAVRSAGIEPFLAYGTLLGAVREKKLLGHDSDADVAYVSAAGTPVDVVRESFRIQRAVHERGFRTYRYSGAAFRVDVVEGDGAVRGLDVFGGFIDDADPSSGTGSRLYQMGEIGADFRREWVYPLTTCTLEGQTFPSPAVPEPWLEAAYGPTWAVPDPAFKFETDPRTVRQLNGWFRGTATNRAAWERTYSGNRGRLPSEKPSPVARKAQRRLQGSGRGGGTVIDVGAGRGGDSLWLARQGLTVHAYDYVPTASHAVQDAAAAEGLDLEVRMLNLDEWRSVLVEGARMARVDGPKVMIARHVADATDRFGRESLARFASMALRGGGRLFLDVWSTPGRTPERVHPVPVGEVARLMEEQGARILVTRERPARAGSQAGQPSGSRRSSRGRLVAQWD